MGRKRPRSFPHGHAKKPRGPERASRFTVEPPPYIHGHIASPTPLPPPRALLIRKNYDRKVIGFPFHFISRVSVSFIVQGMFSVDYLGNRDEGKTTGRGAGGREWWRFHRIGTGKLRRISQVPPIFRELSLISANTDLSPVRHYNNRLFRLPRAASLKAVENHSRTP